MTWDFEHRIMRKVVLGKNGCWLWKGSLDKDGYGFMGVAEKRFRAHRYSYEQLVGPIPKELEIDHVCKVRACINPAHLELVTYKENMRRGASAAIQHPPQNEADIIAILRPAHSRVGCRPV